MNRKLPLKTTLIVARIILLVAFTGSPVTRLWSQQSDTIVPVQKDPEKILRKIDIRKMNQMGFNFWQDNFSGHWAGIDLGFNTFLNPNYSGYNAEFMGNDLLRSNSMYINIIEQNIGLQQNRNTIGLITGLGLHLQSYRLDKSTTIRQNENGIIEPETLYFDQNQKSKLSIVSLMVPLLAEFQVPVNHYQNRFYISAGLFGELRLSSHTKIKYRAEGKKEKLKVPGQYSLHNFKYGLMIRSGYRWFNVFATYDLIPLFKENKGPELTPFTIGITLDQILKIYYIMKPYILEQTNWKQIKNQKYNVAILPWGATEPHNYHLPYGTDSLETARIAADAAKKAWDKGAKVMVLPAIPLGAQNMGQIELPFCLHTRPSTQKIILEDILTALNQQGIRKLVIMNGHGGNDFKPLVRELQPQFPELFISVVEWFKLFPLSDYFEEEGDHANEMETSIIMHYFPELVLPLNEAGEGKGNNFRLKGLKDKTAWAPRNWSKTTADTGIGNPKKATPEKGEKFLEAVTSKIGDYFVELAECDLDNLYE